jgi:exonuclease SbcC
LFKELSIRNFQSHKDTKIEFENGVNVLVGSSDQGKSAILRAIIWAWSNRPLGTDDIVSHWARDDKNKIKDAMAVLICTDTGVVTRRRTADENEYYLTVGSKDNIKTKKFEAVNKEVPEDVIKFFRLTDVNIQQQHDAPFLLSASSSDVAKYFNKIVRLDVIDTVLSNAESERRDTNKKIKETENEKKQLEKQLEDYEWIEQAQALVDKLAKTNEKINILDDGWQVIDAEIQDYFIQKNFLKDFPDVKKAMAVIERIEKIVIDYDGLKELENDIEKYKKMNRDRKIFEMIKSGNDLLCDIDIIIKDNAALNVDVKLLQKSIDEYTENKKLSEMGFDKKKALQIIFDIEKIKPDYETLRLLNSQIQEYYENQFTVDNADTIIEDLKKQLPKDCPICGKPLGECEDNE